MRLIISSGKSVCGYPSRCGGRRTHSENPLQRAKEARTPLREALQQESGDGDGARESLESLEALRSSAKCNTLVVRLHLKDANAMDTYEAFIASLCYLSWLSRGAQNSCDAASATDAKLADTRYLCTHSWFRLRAIRFLLSPAG